MNDSVSGIGGGCGSMVRPPQVQSLSEEQQSVIQETLAEYDADNLSEADAQAIVEAFQEAGIRPGRELAQAMDDAGFDAREVGELAGVEQPRRPPPAAGQTRQDEMLSYLSGLLEEYEAQPLASEDRESIIQAMEERFGMSSGMSLIDLQA